MPSVPVLGRLRLWEWPVLLFSLALVLLESIISFIAFLLPDKVILLMRAIMHAIERMFPSRGDKDMRDDPVLREMVHKIAKARGFVELCRIFGYQAEEHVVITTDGYILGIHRIGGPRGSNWRDSIHDNANRKRNTYSTHVQKPVVYLHHGLLMNDEIWVSLTDIQRTLPFQLADMGYDVWLGNNRGNKYSKKHLERDPTTTRFWDFCIDDFAFFDIPDTINYILDTTGQSDLAYIGFSQGSAQAFAALSTSPALNKKVRIFIAVSPAISPPGLSNDIVGALTRASPSLIYLFFGRKILLESATFWQTVLSPEIFVRAIDISVNILFGWKSWNISWPQKLAAYPHLYSYTSVKSVVHWFQIIRDGRFHIYDDAIQSIFQQDSKFFYQVAPYPTQNISSPILLIYGTDDTLVDIDTMLADLPTGTRAIGIEGHEHLDLIWGKDVGTLVFPHIFSALRQTSDNDDDQTQRDGDIEKVNNASPKLSIVERLGPL